MKRLTAWVFVFFVIRMIPFGDRVLGWVMGKDYQAPLWIVLAHSYALNSLGIANAIAWCFNRNIKAKSDDNDEEESQSNTSAATAQTSQTETTQRINRNNVHINGKNHNKTNATNNKLEPLIPKTTMSASSKMFSDSTGQGTRWQTFETDVELSSSVRTGSVANGADNRYVELDI